MAKCSNCGKEYSIWSAALGEGICVDCARAKKSAESVEESERRSRESADKVKAKIERPTEQLQPKYPALRMIAGVYYVLAWLVGVAAVLFAVGLLISEKASPLSIAGAVGALIGGSLGALSCVAAAELVKVFVDTEENTRYCYTALWQILNRK